ncbi:MAG TPA: protein kinase [Thermoanaerobaculia bacterium]|nr:protein kinase [Thermoanaerobaculia bacterium]
MTTTTNASRRAGLSLGTRVFLVTSLLILLSVGTAVVLTSLRVRSTAQAEADRALKSSAAVQSLVQAQRFQQLSLISGIFAGDPEVAAYLGETAGTVDVASALDQLGEGQARLGFDFAILLNPSGHVIVRTDNPNATGEDLSQRPLVAKAVEDFEGSGIWQEGDRLYYAVAVPVTKAFELYGYLITGFAIDDAAANQVNEVSGSQLAFVTLGKEPRVVATTLSPTTARSLAAALRSGEKGMGKAMREGEAVPRTELTLDGESWLAFQSPLMDAAGKPVGATIALASMGQGLAAYREIQIVLIAAGLFSALLAGGLSYYLVKRTLQPVKQLAAAAEAARQGNYDQRISSERGDEVGQLAGAFDELLADLREKRDMATYVTELSRNLPEPSQGKAAVGTPQTRELLLMGIELRRFARPVNGAGPQATLDLLAIDLKRISNAISANRGHVEGVIGHRVLARFDGASRGTRALAAAAQILGNMGDQSNEETDTPVVALASGRTVTGPVSYGEQMERGVVGLPVQQIESLLREATPGELLLSRDVHEELREPFEQAGYRLAERRGLLSPQPLYVVSGQMASRLTSERGIGLGGPGGSVIPAGAAGTAGTGVDTLSGISPGALMGQRFEILAVLGSGGMGVVYKARDRELDDLVALKMLRKELLGDPGNLERLKAEIKLARKITHPNVLRTHDFGEIGGMPYISMEYVRGVTLRYLLDQTHRLPFSAGLRLAKQLCAGLGAAHAQGVMHRDIKPENLILEPTGNAKLMDFGIARPIKRMEAGQTEAGFIVGTPLYLSPEQLEGQEVDARADIYSTGVVLYEIFTGELPFNGSSAVEIMMKHLRDPAPPPRSHWPEIPPKLEATILRCLEKDPEARYRTVEDLQKDLETLTS